MKKFFTLLTLASTAFAMHAVAPELYFGSTPVQPGKTYETGYTVSETDLGVMKIATYLQDADLFLRGYDGVEVAVDVKATAEVAFCGLNGQCINGVDFHRVADIGVANVIERDEDFALIALDIHKQTETYNNEAPADVLTDVTVTVTAYYTAFPDEKVTAKVLLRKLPQSEVGGVSDVAKDGNYVRLASGNILNYQVERPTKLNVYSVTGSLVLSRVIASQGSVSVDALPAGLYIYQAGGLTGKILVK